MNGETGTEKWGLVPLRVVVGLVFVMHGGLKLFSFGLAGTAAFFAKLGIPFPQLNADLVIAVEILCGLALIVGMFTRWSAIPLAIDMLVAIFVAKLKGGFFAPNGYEFELTLFAACLTLAFLGSGGMSIDAALGGKRSA